MNILIYIVFLILGIFITFPVYAEKAMIITKKNFIREDCRFFTPVRANVRYGDVIEVISKDGDWFRVTYKNVTGCIHGSAIKEKKFTLTGIAGSQSGSPTSDEVALAGKGFNMEVEQSYAKKHPGLDFRTVNKIERYTVPENELFKFIKSGGLKLPQ